MEWGGVPKWLRERSAKPPCIGSNPIAASNKSPIVKALFLFESAWRICRRAVANCALDLRLATAYLVIIFGQLS
jgi:hypothetical protein